MADNRISETREPADKDQKNDDPLSELARIVGFEDDGTTSADDVQETARPGSGFDLEAELMRELEIDVTAPDKAVEAAQPQEQVVATEQIRQDLQDTASKKLNEKVTPIQPDLETGTAGGAKEAWPHATVGAAAQMTSLEAELQAAFSALEGRNARPDPEPVPEPEPIVEPEYIAEPEPEPEQVVPQSTRQPAQEARMPAASAAPIETLSESDELKEAYDRLQKDLDAAKPAEEEPVSDGSELTEMLLAEMAEVESQAQEASADVAAMPFDPSSITESDSSPETMSNLSVPEQVEEETPRRDAGDNDFGLPLEDELDALAAPDPSEFAAPDDHDRASVDYTDSSLEPTAVESAAIYGGDEATARIRYDDEPGMDEYQDDYESDVFPGDDFTVEDLAAPPFDDMSDGQEERTGRRGLVAAAVVLGIAVVGGGGFYLWNSSLGGDSASDGPPVIAADNDPVKVKPDDPGGKTVPNQDLAVYERVAGNDTSANPDQNLVTTTEEPVDVVQRTLDPQTLPLEGRGTAVEQTAKAEDRLAASDQLDPDPTATEAGANGVAPRKVRTLVVKPDGTIVAREAPAASEVAPAASSGQQADASTQSNLTSDVNGSAQAPVAVASALPAATASTSDSLAGSASNGSNSAQSAALPPIDENLRDSGALPLPESRPSASNTDPTQVGSATPNNADLRAAVAAPVPETRPAEQPVNIVEAVTERGNLAGTTPAANPGGYMMQISSQPSEEAARQSYQNLSQRYASIIGDKGVDFQRADIPNRGVFYRVRIPAGSKAEANSLCARYKAAGGSCFVAR
ncbi:SPOR domain-containing protein [Hoeflea poritis]|uniref:SPOR domain-containing protein n=1 Tax=Hoeflea poritis TaxID=2993659 RepID=A0ABT4VPM5_9HYPH|nr:SPOR domain-containing protein [Hoeflea poritis]MDA4846672.1 SPOR domain-containing protein [Hoeflea poritis]